MSSVVVLMHAWSVLAHKTHACSHGPAGLTDAACGLALVRTALGRNAAAGLRLVQVSSWRVSAETATKEKDFYYSKLRAIELLCNTGGVAGSPVSSAAAGRTLQCCDCRSSWSVY
jgi:hypothetical protein